LFLFLLFPTARVIALQLSPFVMLLLMHVAYRIVRSTGNPQEAFAAHTTSGTHRA
jgi:hypothetical protein